VAASHREPRLPSSLADDAARDLGGRDCRTTLFGIVLTWFTGTWVDHPESIRLAENKLIQLEAATDEGLRVPRTLVSQDPLTVRRFCRELDNRVGVKTVAGTPETPIMTGQVTAEMLRSDQAISVSPAIYQELVPGRRPLRICCFGERTYGAVLETDRLDWRYPLDATAAPYEVDGSIAAALQRVLRRLGLRMGVFDLKLDPDDVSWWLGVNPQGQFLFLEGCAVCR
jgi:glutathione synthase/RimK-type ligase-like ATP-grasp enzyme